MWQEDGSRQHVLLQVRLVLKVLDCTSSFSVFWCRCGGIFCAVHRYAETHSCKFDYKAEGRQIIARTNPVVAAQKLPKI